MEVPSFSISEVSSIMLITLYARARESISRNPIIKDPKAVSHTEECVLCIQQNQRK